MSGDSGSGWEGEWAGPAGDWIWRERAGQNGRCYLGLGLEQLREWYHLQRWERLGEADVFHFLKLSSSRALPNVQDRL